MTKLRKFKLNANYYLVYSPDSNFASCLRAALGTIVLSNPVSNPGSRIAFSYRFPLGFFLVLLSILFWTTLTFLKSTICYFAECSSVCLIVSLQFDSVYAVPMSFPGGSSVKNPPANAEDAGDMGSNPLPGKILWRRKRQSTLVYLPGSPMDRGGWQLQSVQSQRVGQDLATKQQCSPKSLTNPLHLQPWSQISDKLSCLAWRWPFSYLS